MSFPKHLRLVATIVPLLLASSPRTGAETVLASPEDRLVEAYRRALATRDDAGTRDAAATLLAAAEVRFLEEGTGDEPADQVAKQLTRLELRAARTVATYDAEALLSVIFLHHDTVVEHNRRRRPHLRQHGLAMVRILVDFYARESDHDDARRLAAGVIASLAGHLQASGSPASYELFERSLALDPSCVPALFGLAAHHEKRGGPYARALNYLARLQEIVPDDPEARLRLAINLERTGRTREARQLLEAALAAPGAGWTYSLAAQELARAKAREGLVDEAVALLEDALRKRPDDQKLHVLLAFLHDQNRAPHESRRLAQRLAAGLAPTEPARGLYNRWPSASLAATRHALRTAAAEHHPLVLEALAAEGSGP